MWRIEITANGVRATAEDAIEGFHSAERVVEPDLILVPLLAVDRKGMRLGQGGGHYDRALPALKAKGARVIGVGWAMQLLDTLLVADPWDVPLDAFASPDGLVEFA